MNNAQLINQAGKESTKLAQEILSLVDNYLETSGMPRTQKIVNAGRAINAAHIEWLKSLSIQTDHKNLSILGSLPESVRIVKARPFPKNEGGFVGVLFILFMTLVIGASVGITKAGDYFTAKYKNELESCIMEQIELSEQNRDSYFPRMRDELLHGFIMKCINDKDFRKNISLSADSPSNVPTKRKQVKGKKQ